MKPNPLTTFKLVDRSLGTFLCWLIGLFAHKSQPSLPPASRVRTILIVKWIGMGDVILTLPAVAQIRALYPQARLVYFTTLRGEAIAHACKDIDTVISFDIRQGIRGFNRALSALKAIRADIAVEFMQRYRLPSLMTYFAGIPYRIGFKVAWQGKSRLLTQTVPYVWPEHEVKVFGRLVGLLGAGEIADQIPPLHFTQTKPAPIPPKSLVLHISTGQALKNRLWPHANFAELARELIADTHHPIILTGAPEDAKLGNDLAAAIGPQAHNLVGQLDLASLHETFKSARLVVSVDTGPMHLAAATGTPTLGLFTASFPEKWAPYGPANRYIYHGPSINPSTPRQHPQPNLIAPITVAEVLTVSKEMLK